MTPVRVEVVHDGAVALLTLARPDRLNALDRELGEQLRDALRGPAADAEAIVLRAEGRAFCAGGDIRAMVDSGDPAAYLRALTDAVHSALEAIVEHSAVVIARVHGPVAGGGIGLVLACDIAVGTPASTFTPAYGAVGLTPDCGVTRLLPEVVGARRAAQFLLTGKRLDAATAAAWGILADVVQPESLDDRVREIVDAVRRSGPSASGVTKRLLRADLDAYRRRLAEEADEIVRHAQREPARARLTEFVSRE